MIIFSAKKCKKNEFDCGEKCIPKQWKCDGDRDCPNGEDENEAKCGPKPSR